MNAPGMAPGAPNATDGLAAAAARSNSVLSSLLLHRQAEEQQKLAQLAALGGAPGMFPGMPPSADNIGLLIQQQQQLNQMKQLQALSGMHPSLGMGVGLPGFAPPGMGLGGFGGPMNPQQLDPASLAKLLQSRAGPPGPVPATAAGGLSDLQRAALLTSASDKGALPLPPDRRRKGRTGTFPQKLHQMLSDLERQEGGSDIASFLPHGRAFAIHKPRDFVKHVMPKYFRMSRFSSFQRQLNLYDFRRITEGPDKGAYFHELFVQGRPILSTMMKRNKIKGVKNAQKDGAKDNDKTGAKKEEDGDDEEEEEEEEEEEDEEDVKASKKAD